MPKTMAVAPSWSTIETDVLAAVEADLVLWVQLISLSCIGQHDIVLSSDSSPFKCMHEVVRSIRYVRFTALHKCSLFWGMSRAISMSECYATLYYIFVPYTATSWCVSVCDIDISLLT